MFLTELKKLQLQGELISIERDCHDTELTGKISRAGELAISMHVYDNEGYYEGLTVFPTEQITSVYWGNREHQAIAHLVNRTEPVTTPAIESREFGDIVIELGRKSASICIYCRHDEDSFDLGQLEAYDDEWLKIHGFGTRKSLSRMYKLISRSDVSRITVNSPYQNGIVDLHGTEL